uniref:G-protein coupled receptors family 1 profile domain-containing protein n=1 Tax=Ascaris lumbricoides TaxID=6252 RepID=A0A9J2PMB9_ASCLU
MAIAIDRFILIVYPMKRPIQKVHALWMIALNITLATAISMPMFLMQKLVDYGNFCGQFCTEDWGNNEFGRSTYGTVVFILQFVVPLIVITFCYTMISLKLNKGLLVKQASKHASGLGTEQRRLALQRRLRTNRMLMAMVGVFLCCWMPTVAFNFLRDYRWLPSFVAQQEYLFGIITHCISMSSTVWNPCLYALLNEQFRLAYVDLLQYCRSGQKRCGTRYTDARCSRLVSNAFLANNSITEENIKLPNSVRRSKHGDYTAVSSSL